MAIQLPRLRPFEAATPPIESGRIEANLPDPSFGSAPMETASKRLAEIGTQFIQQEVENSANEFATQSALELRREFFQGFETGYSPEDTGLKYKTGPEAYTKGSDELYGKVKQKYDKIMSDSSVSDYVKQKAKAKLDKVMGDVSLELNSWVGKTKSDYRSKLAEAEVLEESRGLITVAGPNFNPKDPSTKAYIDDKIIRISEIIKEQARTEGQLLIDENGNEQMSKFFVMKQEKAVSTALRDMVENVAYTPGNVEKAKVLYDNYAQLIDGFGREQTKKKIMQLDLDEKAFEQAQIIVSNNMNPDEINDMLKNVDPELKKKTMQQVSLIGTQRERRNNQVAKENFKAVFQDIFDRQNGPTPYASVLEAQNAHKKVWDSLLPSQLKTIETMIEKPPTSNSESLKNINQAYIDGKFSGMDVETFHQEYAKGLSTTHYNMYLRYFNAANNPDKVMNRSEREKKSIVKSILREELAAQGIVPLGEQLSKTQIQKKIDHETDVLAELNDMEELKQNFSLSDEARQIVRKSIKRVRDGEFYKIKTKPAETRPSTKRPAGPLSAPSNERYSPKSPKATPEIASKRAKLITDKILTPGSEQDTFEWIQKYNK